METSRLKKITASPYCNPFLLYVGWFALSIFILLGAWVCEDAYITFRVIDNAVHGYGLRWNVIERVQVYTHPLWMLLHIPLNLVWDNLFYVNIGLSVFCSAAAIAVALLTFTRPAWQLWLFFLIPFALSKSLMDYSSSGLESPLVFLLFACFGYVLVRLYEHPRFWLYLSFIIALSLVNRLDTVLLFAPIGVYLLCTRNDFKWKQPALGTLPLVGWFLFSLFYYGFLFPNTKYAKLGTELDLSLYLTQGLHYTFIFLTHDTASILLLLAALVLGWKNIRNAAGMLALGVVFYCLYILYIGGDYMMGRFFAFPTFVALWLINWRLPTAIRHDIIFAMIAILIAAHCVPDFVREIRKTCKDCVPVEGRVIDAVNTFRRNALFSSYLPPALRAEGEYRFAKEGKDMAALETPPTKELFYVGMSAYYAGAGATFIDLLGLADPLMARLPAIENRKFYIGHFRRKPPKGYVDVMKGGSLSLLDPDLARYYEKLRIITRDDIWNMERLKTIIYFNAGMYDEYKNAYVAKQKR